MCYPNTEIFLRPVRKQGRINNISHKVEIHGAYHIYKSQIVRIRLIEHRSVILF